MEDFKHNFKPYRSTVKRNFIIKDFLFNNCDICLNPNIIERYVGDNKNYSNSHFVIKTACSNGKWTWGYGIMIHDQGGSCGAGRGSFEKKYGTEKEAINAACEFIREYLKRNEFSCSGKRLWDKQLLTLLNEVEHPKPVELDLFS